jgi:hypothetical protein
MFLCFKDERNAKKGGNETSFKRVVEQSFLLLCFSLLLQHVLSLFSFLCAEIFEINTNTTTERRTNLVRKYPEGACPVCKYGPGSIRARHHPCDASFPVPISRFTHL